MRSQVHLSLHHGCLNGYAYGMPTDHPSERPARHPPEDIWGFLGMQQAREPGWVIEWTVAPPDWAGIRHPQIPEDLNLWVRVARTEDGVAVNAALVERADGRALTARDIRKVKLPPAWALASNLERQRGFPLISPPRPGPRGHGDDHWRAVFDLWTQAQRVAPRSPVRWMLTRWQPEVSDATMRRWVKQARERARVNGWKEDHE
jgi:hypothetical protein